MRAHGTKAFDPYAHNDAVNYVLPLIATMALSRTARDMMHVLSSMPRSVRLLQLRCLHSNQQQALHQFQLPHHHLIQALGPLQHQHIHQHFNLLLRRHTCQLWLRLQRQLQRPRQQQHQPLRSLRLELRQSPQHKRQHQFTVNLCVADSFLHFLTPLNNAQLKQGG